MAPALDKQGSVSMVLFYENVIEMLSLKEWEFFRAWICFNRNYFKFQGWAEYEVKWKVIVSFKVSAHRTKESAISQFKKKLINLKLK